MQTFNIKEDSGKYFIEHNCPIRYGLGRTFYWTVCACCDERLPEGLIMLRNLMNSKL